MLLTCLYCDYDKVVIVDHMANNILEHLATNVDYYKQFPAADLIWDTEGYFIFGNYCESSIDVIILPLQKHCTWIYQSIRKGQMEVCRLWNKPKMWEAEKLTWSLCRTPRIWATTTMIPLCCLTNLVSYWVKTYPVPACTRLWCHYVVTR